jgi:beta-lactamase class D
VRNSVYWYFQEMARRVGPTRMQTYLDRFQYGNRNISGGIDKFLGRWRTANLSRGAGRLSTPHA